jgi:hypothetical protein
MCRVRSSRDPYGYRVRSIICFLFRKTTIYELGYNEAFKFPKKQSSSFFTIARNFYESLCVLKSITRGKLSSLI